MIGVGFEPTRTNTADLKSAPLDLSGIRPHKNIYNYKNVFKSNYLKILYLRS